MKKNISRMLSEAAVLLAVMLIIALLAGSAYADDGYDYSAQEEIHQRVLNLESNFTVTSTSLLDQQAVFANAVKYRGPSGDPNDGDALARILKSISLGTPEQTSDGKYIYHVTATYIQYSKTVEGLIEEDNKDPDDFKQFDKEKELEAREAVAELAEELDIGKDSTKSDAEKMLAIYTWLAANVEYRGPKSPEYLANAILDRKGNCASFADLVYRLSLYAGIDCRITYKYRGDGTNAYHYWNWVKIDGKWYCYDQDGTDALNTCFLTGRNDTGDHKGYGFDSDTIQKLIFGLSDSDIPYEDFADEKYNLSEEGEQLTFAVVLYSNYPEDSGKTAETKSIIFKEEFADVASGPLDTVFRWEGHRISGWTPVKSNFLNSGIYWSCHTAGDFVERWKTVNGIKGFLMNTLHDILPSFPEYSPETRTMVLSYKANWEKAKDYCITFDSNGGTGYMSPQYANEGDTVKVKANTFTRPGYVFAYWSGNPEGTNGEVPDRYVIDPYPARDYSFYAIWKSSTIRITFDYGDGKNSSFIDVPYSKLEAGTRYYFPTLKREGYKLTGWKNSKTGEIIKDSIFSYDEPEAVKFIAQWNAGNYTIAYHPNNTGNDIGTFTQQVDIGKTATLKANRFSWNGRTFTGWNTAPDGSGTPYAAGQKVKDLTTEWGGTVDLYAQWAATQYKITFVYGEGHSNSYQYKEAGKSLTLTMPRFTDGNKTIVKWYPDTLAGMTGYDPGETVTFTADRDTCLTAKWESGSYTVNFDGNGAVGGSTASKKYVLGKTYVLPSNNFYKTGYRFSSWNTAADGSGTTYSNKQEVTNLCSSDGGSITLYARWVPTTYNVTIDCKNGSAVTTYEKVNGENLVFNLPVPEKRGYELDKFKCSADGNDYTPGYTITYTADRSATFTAQWQSAGKYSIVYSANGGGGSQGSNWCYRGASYSMAACSFTPPDWKKEFKEWNTAPDGSGTSYTAGQTYKNLAAAGDSITLYAQWRTKLIPYQVHFNGNGGNGSMADQTMYIDHSANIRLNSFTRSGYRFDGWSTSSSGSGTTYFNGQNVTNLVNTENASITLYARWVKEYTWKFYVDGSLSNTQTFDAETMATMGSASKDGKFFDYWTDAGGAKYYPGSRHKVESDKNFYANFTTSKYTLTFNANGGTGAPSAITQSGSGYVTLPSTVPTRSGYVFKGWASGSSATSGQAAGSQYMLTKSATLYAAWLPEVTITFNANGGTGGPAPITKGKGETGTVPYAKPERTDYTFLGWADTASATSPAYTPGGSLEFSSSKTLYAVWKTSTYTVTFDANGGYNAPSAQSRSGRGNITLTTAKPSRSNYLFLYWSGAGSTYSPGATVYLTGDLSLTAVWEYDPPTYTLSFNANGGTGAPTATFRKGPGTVDIPTTVPTRTGYEFLGWARTSYAASAGYQPGGTINISGDTSVYAVWKIKKYSCTAYYYGGHTSKVCSYGEYWTPSEPSAPSGYSFAGWSTSSSPTAEGLYGSFTVTGQKTVYAVYRKYVENITRTKTTYTGETTNQYTAYATGHYGVTLKSSTDFYNVKYYTTRRWLTSSKKWYYSGCCTKNGVTSADVAYYRSNYYNVSATYSYTTKVWTYKYDSETVTDNSYWSYYSY